MAKSYLDSDGVLYFWQKIKNLFVVKENGKGLSTNDYTTAEKNKLAGIAEGATNVTVDTALSSSSTNPVQNKVINTALGNKVDKVSGKGLSTNDFTTAEKNKLAGISTGANKTTVDPSLSETSSNPVQNQVVKKALDLKAPLASPALTGTPTAPTATVGTNTTQIATTAFVSTAITNAVSGITQFSYEVVASLPATGVNGKIYLVAHSHGTGDAYDEYIWTGSEYEKIGNTDIDLSGYMLTTDMVAITNAEIDTIVAS